MVSTDNEATWTAGGAAPVSANWYSLATDGHGNWIAVADSSVATMYSTNNGATWAAGGSLPGISATAPQLATDGAGHWVATDDGRNSTWVSSYP